MGYQKILETIGKYVPNPIAIELNKWVDELRKENDALRRENDSCREENKKLKRQIEELSAPSSSPRPNVPSCPNCSTASRPVFMSKVPKDFIQLLDATHECQNCGFREKYLEHN